MALLINFKVSYKDAYKKRAPLAVRRAPSSRFASTPLGGASGTLRRCTGNVLSKLFVFDVNVSDVQKTRSNVGDFIIYNAPYHRKG